MNRRRPAARSKSEPEPQAAKRPPGVKVAWIIVALAVVAAGAWQMTRPRGPKTPNWEYSVVAEFRHDTAAFTQGLVFDRGQLIEGTGQVGESQLRRVDLKTGKVLDFTPLDDEFFGEGVAVVGDEVIQLTWKAGVAVYYDRETFKERRRVNYSGQGWGLAYDGKQLAMSDGSSTLKFRDPETFAELRSVVVKDRGRPVGKLNELEFYQDHLLANVWMRDRIAVIDPATGEVQAWIPLDDLWTGPERDDRKVLNGIAYDAKDDRLFVTGKLWPKMYEIKVKQD